MDRPAWLALLAPLPADVALSEHERIGGRFEADGVFNGTCWHNRLISVPGSDAEPQTQSTSSIPVAAQVSALRELVAEVMRRAHRG